MLALIDADQCRENFEAVGFRRPGGGLAFDPVRERLLFTRVVRSESDLVLARLP